MFPYRDENETIRTPYATFVLIAINVAVWLFIQGGGMSEIALARSVCNLGLIPGELTLLMGPSGSGKTTLLSILGCILGPTSGSIRVAGTPTANLGPEALADVRRRHIGFVFQSYNLFPTLNAEENAPVW